MKRQAVHFAHDGSFVFGGEVVQAVRGEHDVDPVEIGTAEGRRLDAEARDPEPVGIGGGLGDAPVDSFEPVSMSWVATGAPSRTAALRRSQGIGRLVRRGRERAFVQRA